MNLEDWIKQDMDRYIGLYEPKLVKNTYTARKEDNAQLEQIDYEKLIRKSLQNDRFQDAQTIFNKLKQRFFNIPITHKQERVRVYELLQKCYKMIYDYVEEKKRASKVLAEFNYSADVFNNQIRPKDLKAEQLEVREQKNEVKADNISVVNNIINQAQKQSGPVKQPKSAVKLPSTNSPIKLPSVNKLPSLKTTSKLNKLSEPTTNKTSPKPLLRRKQLLKNFDDVRHEVERQKKQLAKLQETSAIKLQDHKRSFEEKKEVVKETEKPVAPKTTLSTDKPARVTKQEIIAERQKILEEIRNLGLKTISAPKKKKTVSSEKNSANKVNYLRVAKEKIQQVETALRNEDVTAAKQNIIEAKQLLTNIKNKKELSAKISKLEQKITKILSSQEAKQEQKELFSSLYYQGMQALYAKNYKLAAQLFAKRVRQAPNDLAARIRLQTCLEVLNEQNTR